MEVCTKATLPASARPTKGTDDCTCLDLLTQPDLHRVEVGVEALVSEAVVVAIGVLDVDDLAIRRPTPSGPARVPDNAVCNSDDVLANAVAALGADQVQRKVIVGRVSSDGPLVGTFTVVAVYPDPGATWKWKLHLERTRLGDCTPAGNGPAVDVAGRQKHPYYWDEVSYFIE